MLDLPNSKKSSTPPLSFTQYGPTAGEVSDSTDQQSDDYGYKDWYADQTPENLYKVVNNLKPIIGSALNSYLGKQVPATVAQRAKLMAAQAIRSYDPTKGKLKQHIYGHLQGLQRIAPQVSDPLAAPERFRHDQRAIYYGAEQLADKLGREATDEEIADHVGITPKRVARVRKRSRAGVPMSAVEHSGTGDDEESTNDVVTNSVDPYDDWIDAVYHDLPPVDKLILQHRSGYRGADKLTHKEIGELVRLSPQAVQQRASRIQTRLDEFHG